MEYKNKCQQILRRPFFPEERKLSSSLPTRNFNTYRNPNQYLGLILDKRVIWGPLLKSKHITLNGRLHLLRPILIKKLYKSMLMPNWAYGVQQLWGYTKLVQTK